MPLVLPPGRVFPAAAKLREMGVIVHEGKHAQEALSKGEVLRVGLINLMPAAVRAKTVEQFFLLLGKSDVLVVPVLVRLDHYVPKVGREEYQRLYEPLSKIQSRQQTSEGLSGLIISGANLELKGETKQELLPFEEIFYYRELCEAIKWARCSVPSTVFSCLSAHLALKIFYGIERSPLGFSSLNLATDTRGHPSKTFGVYKHIVERDACPALTKGMGEIVRVPMSRWGDISLARVKQAAGIGMCHAAGLRVVMANDTSGWHMLVSDNSKEKEEEKRKRVPQEVYLQGHPEYYQCDLAAEYFRDKKAGVAIKPPAGYFPNDDDTKPPPNSWKDAAFKFYANWTERLYHQLNDLGEGEGRGPATQWRSAL
jgi:homoserine O-succinyltransferase